MCMCVYVYKSFFQLSLSHSGLFCFLLCGFFYKVEKKEGKKKAFLI